MRVVRRIGGILSWVLAAVGVLAGAVWIATTAGLVQPLIVVSGSMNPGIQVGDLLVAVPVAVEEVRVGEIVSLPNPQTGTLVTHRVLDVARNGDGYAITMQGDANEAVDPLPYFVAADASVWHPALTLPGVGVVVDRIARPSVAIPLLVTVAALMLFAALPGGPRRSEAEPEAGAEPDSGTSMPETSMPESSPPGAPPPGDEAHRSEEVRT